MKLLSSVFVTEVDGEFVAVAAGEAAKKFSGMIQMNGTAAFVVGRLQNNTTVDGLVADLVAEYDVTEEVARRNVEGILSNLRKAGWLEE